jgi:hypothetical protein
MTRAAFTAAELARAIKAADQAGKVAVLTRGGIVFAPPSDLAGLTDAELARYCWAMGHRYADGCADHVWRLLLAAAERLEGRNG